MTADPPSPQGVWLEYADGTRYENVPTVYTGYDPDIASHIYEVLPPRDEDPTSAGMALFPAHTSIRLPILAPGSEIP